MTGLWIALGTLVAALPVGLLWRHRQGRVRMTAQPATTQSATTQPATTQPATTQPATTQPATTQPATTQPVPPTLPEPVARRVDSTAAVTLVLLTAAVCARCPQARTVLGEVAAATPGIRLAELDLTEYPELPGELGVRSTPTTLAISRTGYELFRVSGVPRRAELLNALQAHL